MIRYSSLRNISAGAIKYFNESNISDKDPTHTGYMLDTIFHIVDSKLAYNNEIYDTFWKKLNSSNKKAKDVILKNK